MWKHHKELHKRIVSILGEDVKGDQEIVEITIWKNSVGVEIYERYDKSPKNLAKKKKDCIRFVLFFKPLSVSVFKTQKRGYTTTSISFLDEKQLEIEMGEHTYKFEAEKITFHSFQALSYAKVVDNNFGKMLD